MQHPVFKSLLLAAALAASPATAAPPPVQSFFLSPATSMVELSPKGGYVAMVIRTADGKQGLVVRSTAAPEQATVITTAGELERFSAVHWVNEQRIGFTIKDLRNEFEGNLDEFAADRDGANVVHLISGNWRHRQQSTGSLIGSRILTSDYAYYSPTHDGSDDILVQKFGWNAVDLAPEHSRLYRLDTRTRTLRPAMEGAQPPASLDWLTDASDVPRIVTIERKGRCIVSYRAPEADSWQEIANSDCYLDRRYAPLFFDGAEQLFVSASYQGRSALFRYNLKTMRMEAEPYVDIPGFDFQGSPVIDYGSERVLGLHLVTDARTTAWFYPSMKEIQSRLDALLPGTNNLIHCPANCKDAPVLLVESSSDRQPLQYILYYRASGKLVGLGGSHPAIQPAAMGKREFLRYQARDGRQIPAYLTRPADAPAGPLPAVVLVHGGPWLRGGSWEWEAEAQFLASRGYLVIQPEFRGGTGFGAEHFRAGWKQWGLAMQDDLADAARWAIAQGWADPRRVAIMGASYGGYATLMGLINNPELFRCGVEWAGVTDIGLKFTVVGSDAPEEYLNYGARTLIGDPERDAAQFRRTSPLLRAAEIRQPLLMAHGAEDRRVPLEHATRLRDAVKAANPAVTAIIYNNEGHGWRHDDNNIDFWTRVEAFLDRNLKPTAPPAP
ncbi:alpha/beta hydrolase family protein [Oxalobacteraceae bacterium A2-2]